MDTDPQSDKAQEQIEATELLSPDEQLPAATEEPISTDQTSSELNKTLESEVPQLHETADHSAGSPPDYISTVEPHVIAATPASRELSNADELNIPHLDEAPERSAETTGTASSYPLPATVPQTAATVEIPSQSSDTSVTFKSQPWHHTLATDILDKQYRLYSWNDAKSLSLITTNSVLLAAIGFLFKECIPDAFSLLMIMIALVLVALSLYFSLKQVIPQGSSGRSGAEPNVRALRSITQFKNWEAYHTQLLAMDEEESFQCAARQIYGMALNNDASRATTTKGVRLTLIGIFFILLSTFGVSLSARNIHVLGTWVIPVPQASEQVDDTTKVVKPKEQPVSPPGIQVNAQAEPSPVPVNAAEPSPTPASPTRGRKRKK